MLRTIIGAAVLVALTAGCAAPGATSAEQQPPSPTPSSPAPSPTPTPEGPSVAQFASLVAEHHAQWDEQVATVEDACGDPTTVTACMLGYVALGIQGQTIQLTLSSAHDSSTGLYIGEPPAEIADLLRETEEAAAAVQPAYDALSDAGCKDPLETECGREYLDLLGAVDDVSAKLDAWGPYS